MNVQCHKTGRCLVVTVSGEMDHHAADLARHKIDEAYHAYGALHIVFDCSKIRFMDSAGLGLIMGRYKTASSLGGRTLLAHVSPQLDRILNMGGLYKIIQKTPDVENAVRMLEGGKHRV